MALTDKLKNIADAIRFHTEKPNLLTLEGMVKGVYDVYDVGLEDGMRGVPYEVHKITIASDNASSTDVATWWLTNNEFVKEHYADEGFMLQLISLQAHAEGYGLCYSYNGNREIMALGQNLAYGFRLSRTTASTTDIATVSGKCAKSNYSGVPYVKADGSVVSIHKSGVKELKAGDYLLILSVAEV